MTMLSALICGSCLEICIVGSLMHMLSALFCAAFKVIVTYRFVKTYIEQRVIDVCNSISCTIALCLLTNHFVGAWAPASYYVASPLARRPAPAADLPSLSFGILNSIKHNSTKDTKVRQQSHREI